MLTERDIEIAVEHRVNRLDKQFMADNSTMTQEEYDRAMREIDNWAQQEFNAIHKMKHLPGPWR